MRIRSKFITATLLFLTVASGFCADKELYVSHVAKKPNHCVITLEQAYDMTLVSDQTIRTAYYEIRKANLLPWSALTKLGPQINARGSWNTQRQSIKNDIMTGGSLGSGVVSANLSGQPLYTDTQFFGFYYKQPIFDPAVFPAYRYGSLTAKAARLQHQYTVRQTLFGVAQAYYDVLKQQQFVKVNQETVNLAQEQLRTAQARFDAGAVARIDVLRAQSSLESARNLLIQFQGAEEIARNVLANILNLGGVTSFTLVEPPDAPNLGTGFEPALEEAYARREDYKVSAIGIDQSIAQRGEVIAQYGPTLYAEGQAQWSRTQGDNPGRDHLNAATLTISVPIMTGGQREIDMFNSRYNISEARLNHEKTAKAVETEVKNAVVNVKTGRDSIKALQADVAANTQNYKDVEAQYQAGTATSLDAQVALRDLNNARTLLANQMYDYQVALRDLQRAQALFQQERVMAAKIK